MAEKIFATPPMPASKHRSLSEAKVGVRAERDRLRIVLDALGPHSFVGLLTREGLVLEVNASALKVTGLKSSECLGKPFDQLACWGYSNRVQAQMREAMQRAAAGVMSRFDVQLRTHDSRFIWIDFSLCAAHDANGAVTHLVPSGAVIEKRKQVEDALRQLRRRSDLILESIGEGIHGVDIEGNIIFENSAATKLLGYRTEELEGMPAHSTVHHTRPDGAPHPVALCAIHATLSDGKIRRAHDELFWRKDGSSFPVDYTTAPIRNEKNEITGAVVAFRDITDQLERRNRNRRLNRVYAMLSGINTLITQVRDRAEFFREACRTAVEAGAFTMAWIGFIDSQTLEGKIAAVYGDEEGHTDGLSLMARAGTPDGELAACRALRQSHPVICNDIATDVGMGEHRSELLRQGHKSVGFFPLTTAGGPAAVIALFSGEPHAFDEEEARLISELSRNISFALDHIEKEEKLNYLAYYDVLTGLANRNLFIDRVAQYLLGAGSGDQLAVGLIDLERFKYLNHSLGRPAGDALLRQVADWLTRQLGDVKLIARVGADHFAVVLTTLRHADDLALCVEKTMEALLRYPFNLNGATFRIAAKAGIALYPDDGTDADTLLKNAEAALKKAKVAGDRYLFYAQKMTETAVRRLTLENQLRDALDRQQFVLHYQPKVNLISGKLAGAEALIRWNDPRTGLVPPGRFIPVLEETGLIYEVGHWALRKAIDDYLRWRRAGLPAPRIAVNVSQLQLRNRGFITEIEEAIGIDSEAAAGLELEITESVVMGDVAHSIAALQSIRDMGISIAIDDFGTGFSSLSCLSKLPVETLKIDRSFVVDMTASPEGLSLVSTIINLAHSFKLKVVAEGVETEEQSRLLRLLSCDEMQGYLFGRPVAAEIFEQKYLVAAGAG
ncbi:MAG: domain S-box protein [Gammaproteobacteria bacterium]|nr:domain S-box protein [Gammaproteobacteria bacterium]